MGLKPRPFGRLRADPSASSGQAFHGGFSAGVYRSNPLYLWYPSTMKSRYQYRIYPTPGQQTELAKLFGCCRVVWNDALALIKAIPQGEKWPSNAELQRLVITQAKQEPVPKLAVGCIGCTLAAIGD